MNNTITRFNGQKDALFILIKSLSKSEKRQFNLYVSRLEGNTETKFFSLFKFLEKQNTYDEKQILNNKIVSKQQLSNLKAHLYKQILISLRLSFSAKNIRIKIREQLDFATILYEKGLYKQSLKLLEKAKNISLENEEKNIAYEIVEFEKIIESQYITRSINSKSDQLTSRAKLLSQQNMIASALSNLSLQLYGTLLKTGYVRNDAELQKINRYFYSRLPECKGETLGFREKLWLYKAHLWHSLLTQDFLSSYRYANKWTNLFRKYPKNIETHPVFYLKGMNYLLESLFFTRYLSKFKVALSHFEKEIENSKIPSSNNTEILIFQYYYANKLNLHFLEGSFNTGEYLIPTINRKIESYKNRLDNHHIAVFYYKIACLYFGMGQNQKCIDYLKKIINSKNVYIGEDLQCFSRILNLIAHYESGLDYDLERQFKSTYKFLLKMENLQAVQKELLSSIKKLSDVFPSQIKDELKKIYDRLKVYQNHPYEKRAFLYLDILSWLESKIQNKTVAQIIKQKALNYK